ncbi:MAG TPA: SDR family NAD(P)-dependent oxidoreductase [Polyangiaceae bacterium]|jgi:NAD(P)-dependent dehydrogenase (short-subunit alcohol dehydrogenase family)
MGEVALVTGAAGALGAEVARALHAKGYSLALVDASRGADRLRALAASLGGASIAAGDIAEQATWSEAMPRIERELGGPPTAAALIAGSWAGGKALHEESDDAAWDAMMRANVATAHRSLRALLPPMVARKRGSIVVIGSRAAVNPETSANAAAYAASKAALLALARAVAAEVLAHGVRVNAVLPSTMDTPANRAAMPDVDPGRWVSLGSAAGLVAFLLSDEARDVSGAAVPIYGRA